MTRRLLSCALPFMDSLEPAPRSADAAAIDEAFQMDEDAFRAFYARTAGTLWAYLARGCGDASAADDLLQEAYYRLLRTRHPFDSDDHRRHYLFKIATNLIRDRYRRPRPDSTQLSDQSEAAIAASGDLAAETQQRADLDRAMARLTPRERGLVWLAYGQGSSHQEIAGALGLRTGSIKPMLFRAKRKLIRLLREGGWHRGR